MLNESKIVVKSVPAQNICLPCKQDGFDFVINPYIGCPNPCKYCYASFMRRFAKHREQWGEFLDVKEFSDFNAARYTGKRIMIGSVTDPYNIFEEKLKNTRKILKKFENIDCFIVIFTKSDLILKDLDILKKLKNVKVAISLSTLDQSIASDLERSYSVDGRLATLKKLHQAGIKTIVNISPIIPYLTYPFQIIDATKAFADEYIFESLTLRNEFKPAMINYIWDKFPQYLDDFNKIYKQNDDSYFCDIYEKLDEFCLKNQIKYKNLIKID